MTPLRQVSSPICQYSEWKENSPINKLNDRKRHKKPLQWFLSFSHCLTFKNKHCGTLLFTQMTNALLSQELGGSVTMGRDYLNWNDFLRSLIKVLINSVTSAAVNNNRQTMYNSSDSDWIIILLKAACSFIVKVCDCNDYIVICEHAAEQIDHETNWINKHQSDTKLRSCTQNNGNCQSFDWITMSKYWPGEIT